MIIIGSFCLPRRDEVLIYASSDALVHQKSNHYNPQPPAPGPKPRQTIGTSLFNQALREIILKVAWYCSQAGTMQRQPATSINHRPPHKDRARDVPSFHTGYGKMRRYATFILPEGAVKYASIFTSAVRTA